MSREKALLKNTIFYFIGTFGSKVLSFLLLPLYANYLTQSAFGRYDLINTLVQLLYPLVTVMMDQAVYVFVLHPERYKREDILAVALKILGMNSAISILAAAAVNCVHPIEYLPWIVAWLLTSSAYNVYAAICRAYRKPLLYSICGIFMTTITLAGNILGILILKMDYKSLIIANIAASAGGLLILESKLHLVKHITTKVTDKELTKRIITYSLPLIPNTLSWWVVNMSDRLMITYFMGSAANGIYSMASKIPAVLTIVHSIFSNSWSDDIINSKDMAETTAYANRVYNVYITLMIGISFVLIGGNKLIYEYVIGGNFVESCRYTYFLYVGCIFQAMSGCLGAFYGYYKLSGNLLYGSIAAAVVNCVINVFFIPVIGIEAASFSTFAGFFVMWVIRVVGLRKLVSIRITLKNQLLFVALIPFYFTYLVEGKWQNLLLVCVSGIIFCVINRAYIEAALQYVKRRMKKSLV